MDMKQIITATVAVILVCLVAIPIIESTSTNVYIEENNVKGAFSAISNTSSGVSVEFEIINTTNGTFKINGVEYTTGSGGAYDNYSMYSDAFTLMIIPGTTAYVDIPSGSRTQLSNGDKFTASEGTWAYTPVSGDPKTGTYKYIVYTDPNGDFAAHYAGNALYATKGANYFAINPYNSSTGGLFAHGTIGGEYTVDTKYTYSNGVATPYPYDVEVNIITSEIENNDLSVKIDNFYKTVTNESGEKTEAATMLIIPIKYMAITENGTILLSIINIIPILLIAAVMIGIGYSIMRRD